MHIKVDVDISPEEVRRLMGLPDVQGFDGAVTGFKVDPQGDFDGSTSFGLTYEVRIP